jgi:hypothetical protein
MNASVSTETSGRLAARFQSQPVNRLLPWFLLGCFAFLYLQTFALPRTPLWLSGDALIFLNHAARMLEGEVIYRDFFQLTTPGTEFVYYLLFKLFGPRLWLHNAVIIGLGLSLTWLSVAVAGKVIAGWAALLPGLLFLALQFRLGLNGTHHWFSVLLVMAAVALLITQRSAARLAVAGALCGLASCFTQTRGVVAVAGLALFVMWEGRRNRASWRALLTAELWLGAAFLGALVIGLAYFVWQAGLERFIDCTVVFPLGAYRSVTGVNTWSGYLRDLPRLDPEQRPWRWAMYLFTYALIPLVYAVFWLRYRRGARAAVQTKEARAKWERLMLLNLVGLSLFGGVAFAPIWYRLSHIALPGLILLVALLAEGGRRRAVLRWLSIAVIAGMAYTSVAQQTRARRELDLPAGRAAFQGVEVSERYRWLAQQTQPGEYFYAASIHFYFPLRLRNPAAVTFLYPTQYTRPEQVRALIAALERHRVRLVYWLPMLDLPPGRPARAGDHLPPLRDYLRLHYQVSHTFANGEYVWERR